MNEFPQARLHCSRWLLAFESALSAVVTIQACSAQKRLQKK